VERGKFLPRWRGRLGAFKGRFLEKQENTPEDW
jgi:hypothetical protein